MTEVDRIGRYQIQAELGRGAMGVVYRAHDPAIGRTIAIKTIRLTTTSRAEERANNLERLRREAQLAGRLSHPGIVTVFDIFEEGDTAYICMEYVEGPTLENLLAARQPFSQSTVLDILRQAAEALDYAHSRGVVHRDIKPANLMLHENRLVKIADFGIGKVVSEETTMSGNMLGTPSYMSPEQVQSKPVGGRSDQFSLAVIAYELLTGAKPFNGYSLASVVYKVCNDPPPAVQLSNSSLPAELDAVFHRALAKDPAMRYPNASQFVAALTTVLQAAPEWTPIVRTHAKPEQITIQHGVLPVPEPAIERRSGTKASAWIFGLLGVAVVAGAVWFGTRDGRPTPAPPPPQQPPASAPPAEALERKPSPALEQDETPPEQKAETTTPAPQPEPKRDASEGPDDVDAPPAPVQAFAFRVDTNPDQATVTIDDISGFTCRTPCKLTLGTGRHSLKIERDGYRPQFRTVSVPEQSSLSTTLERRTGTVMVRSNPPGALILVNGKEWSSHTPTMMTLPAGKYKLEFRKEGFRNEESNIEVRDGAVMNLDVNWTQNK